MMAGIEEEYLEVKSKLFDQHSIFAVFAIFFSDDNFSIVHLISSSF